MAITLAALLIIAFCVMLTQHETIKQQRQYIDVLSKRLQTAPGSTKPAPPKETPIRRRSLPSRGAYRIVTVEATAYCPCTRCTTGANVTATGLRPHKGVIAIDPDVLPMHATIVVPGYGVGKAEDTGSAITGHRIDVFFPSHQQALQWGRRTVTVKVYGRPS